jgi:hypothetical protein
MSLIERCYYVKRAQVKSLDVNVADLMEIFGLRHCAHVFALFSADKTIFVVCAQSGS